MTNEEFERKAEFIVNQQAQFAVDIQKLKEAQAATEEIVAQTTKNIDRLTGVVDHITSVLDQLMAVTHEGFRFVFESFKETNAKFDALVDSQILTDERLRDLAAKMDRHISEGHRGLNSA